MKLRKKSSIGNTYRFWCNVGVYCNIGLHDSRALHTVSFKDYL